ncbi:MAG TPA: ROK family protein [Acetobacteraceae bacterium]|nr:ROK family protein [Acetobacteraceae bacterium]
MSNSEVVIADQSPVVAGSEHDGKITLAIDIGGTRLKAGLLDPAGRMFQGPIRTETPHPATPVAVVDALVGIVRQLGHFDRVSVGFPGVVRKGVVRTAPNLGTEQWAGFWLADELARRLGKPVRVANDGTVQGLGVISGKGVECVITLGTGMGFAVFQDGFPGPHLELSQHIARKDKTYDQYVGNATYLDIGRKRWNKRVTRVIAALDVLVNYDALLIGGGNSKHIDFDLPEHVRVVPNEAGITGGVQLWAPKMDDTAEFRTDG